MKRLILTALLGLFWTSIVFAEDIKNTIFGGNKYLLYVHNQMKYKGGQTIKTLFLSI